MHVMALSADRAARPSRVSPAHVWCPSQCYRPNDLVLAMVHRAANLQVLGVAGLGEVRCEGVENVDVSDVVSAHHKYRHTTSDVLSMVGLEDPF